MVNARYFRFGCSIVLAVLVWAAVWQVVPGRLNRPLVPVQAATATLGGINVEPSARPWRYLGANPDSWWCPNASQCTTSNPKARIDSELSLAHQLNVANVRLEIPWFLVEPGRGSYDWSRADYIFSSARSHRVVINPILVYTPAWDGAYNAFPVAADFGAFVSAFMARYGDRITAVEMWNEPDGGQSLASNNPATYVNTILIPGYNAVKHSSYPNVQVIEGGSINDAGTCCAWLSGIYSAGGGNYFDIAAFHTYGGNFASIAQQYQSVLSANGHGRKPIWLGEFGVSDPSGSQQSSLIYGAMANTAALAMAQFYTLRDESVYTCCPPAATGEHKQYGVVAADGVTRKSSFATIQSLLGGSSPPPPPPAASPPPAATPVAPTPSPSPAKTSPSPSPSTGNASPVPAGTGSAGGGSGPGALAGNVHRADTKVFYFAILLIGVVMFLFGLALTANIGMLAKSVPAGTVGERPSGGSRLLQSILIHRSAVGFGIATSGAILCLAALFLMNR